MTARKSHLDILRILAIYMVIYNHTMEKGFFLFASQQGSPFYWLYLGWSVVITVAVPLFWMVTGALLLGREETFSTLLRKRLLRFAGVLLLFSMVMWAVTRPGDYSVGGFLLLIYQFPIANAYWYLYAYLGYLILLPFLRKIAAGLDHSLFLWLVFWRLALGAGVPVLELAAKLAGREMTLYSGFGVPIILDVLFYPLAGYYLENRLPEKWLCPKRLWLLTAAAGLGVGLSCLLTTLNCGYTGDWSEAGGQGYFRSFGFLLAFCLYLWARYLTEKRLLSSKGAALLEKLGGLTFGTMLVEELIRIKTPAVQTALEAALPAFPAALGWALWVTLAGMGLTWVLKKLPFLRNLL